MENLISAFIKNICNELEEENVAIFAGAGLSVPAGYVSWKELLKPIADELGLNIEREHDLVSLAQYHCNEHGANRSAINNLLINEFARNVQITENHKILARLPIRTFWTTNYDKLLEIALEKEEKKVDVKYTVKQLAFTKPRRDAIIYKMHGDIDHPTDAIITKDDYESYHVKKQPFLTTLAGDLISKTFIFIGLSFTDPNLDYIFSRVRIAYNENQRRHYCFLRKVQRTEEDNDSTFEYKNKKLKYFISDLKRFNIDAILVDKFEDITKILGDIERRFRRRSIFISGAGEDFTPWTKNEAEMFVQKLSTSLIKNNFKIVSGFGVGIGSSVISGALKHIYMEQRISLSDQLILRPFPCQFSSSQDKFKIWHEYREDMISYSGAALFLFGNKLVDGKLLQSNGMRDEFEIAKEKNLFLLPIGATGFMAKELWEEVNKNFDSYNPNCSHVIKTNFTLLGDEFQSPDNLIKYIIEIFSELTK